MSAPMKHYEIHRSLDGFEGESGRVYTCTRGAVYRAPRGDFKALGQGAYSLIEPAGDESDDDDSTDDEK